MKKFLILTVFFLVSSFVVIYGIAYMIRLHNTNRYPDGIIAEDSISFSLKGVPSTVDMTFLEETIETDFTLLYPDMMNPNNYHVIYTKGEHDLFSGRFPSDWDFRLPTNCAFSGEEADHEGKEIIGTLSDEDVYARRFASLFLDTALSEVKVQDGLIITSEMEGHAREVYDALSTQMEKLGYLPLKADRLHVRFGEYDEGEAGVVIIAVLFWGIMMVITGVAAHFWFSVRKSYYRVLVMFGARAPLLKVYLPFLLIAAGAFLVQWLAFYLTHGNSKYITGLICNQSMFLYCGLMIPVAIMAVRVKTMKSCHLH